MAWRGNSSTTFAYVLTMLGEECPSMPATSLSEAPAALNRLANRSLPTFFAEVQNNPPRPQRDAEHCSKFVVVACSERFKRGINGSSRPDCKCLKNIVQAKIFKSRQNRSLYYLSDLQNA